MNASQVRRLADGLTVGRAVIGLPLIVALSTGCSALAWWLLLLGGLSDAADGALARDHGRVVIGVDEDQALIRRQRMGMGRRFGERRAMQYYARTPGFRAGHLGSRGKFRHDDGGRDAGE